MENRIIGKYQSSRLIDLGDIYPVGYAIFKGNISDTIEYSLDNVRYFKEKNNLANIRNIFLFSGHFI